MANLSKKIAGIGIVTAMLLIAGCDNKGNSIPNVPPTAAQTPGDILVHMQYLAAWKNYKHLILIAPISPDVVLPSAKWLHLQAKNLGINLTPEEVQGLGIEKLVSKLDNLPGTSEPGYGIDEARLAFRAGIYRLIKGLSVNVWANMQVAEVKQSPANIRVTDVTLAYGGKAIMRISCIKKVDTGGGGEFYAVSYIQYVTRPETVK